MRFAFGSLILAPFPLRYKQLWRKYVCFRPISIVNIGFIEHICSWTCLRPVNCRLTRNSAHSTDTYTIIIRPARHITMNMHISVLITMNMRTFYY